MRLKLGLVGAGIAKSKMPALQEHLGKLAGVPLTYELFDGAKVDAFNPIQQLHYLVDQGYSGFNITHPYKEDVLRFVSDVLVPDHEAIGSYNTINVVDRTAYGANTDYTGLIRAFRYRMGDSLPGRVLLCGAGGVGRAAAFAFKELGASSLGIFDIDDNKSKNLVGTLRDKGLTAEVVQKNELDDYAVSADGLVNCTALGMYLYPGCVFSKNTIGLQQWALDVVYTPLKTEFLQHCETAGIACVNGLDLFFFQGIDAFYHYTNTELDVNLPDVGAALGWFE